MELGMARTPSSQCNPDSDGRTLVALPGAQASDESLVQQRANAVVS